MSTLPCRYSKVPRSWFYEQVGGYSFPIRERDMPPFLLFMEQVRWVKLSLALMLSAVMKHKVALEFFRPKIKTYSCVRALCVSLVPIDPMTNDG